MTFTVPRTIRLASACCAALLALATRPATAQVTWNWSFGPYAGQFVTNGSAPGGIAPAGTYSFSDFSVTGGPVANLGSVSGGQYSTGGFGTTPPYAMVWDGSDVTDWVSSGFNSFRWWVFNDVVQSNQYVFFGWQTGNINNIHHASYYDSAVGCCGQASFPLTITPAAPSAVVPEPGTYALLATGLAGVGIVARRRRA